MGRRRVQNLLPSLIEAAEQLVAETGRREVTLRRIAERVTAITGDSVTHTAAFAHVGGQLELLAHVSQRWWSRLADELRERSRAGSPERQLAELALHYRDFAVRHPRQFRVMYDEEIWQQIEARQVTMRSVRERAAYELPQERAHRFHHPEVLDAIVAHRDACLAEFAGAVSAGVERGDFRRDIEPEYLTRSITALAHGLAMEALDEQLAGEDVEPIVMAAISGLRAPR